MFSKAKLKDENAGKEEKLIKLLDKNYISDYLSEKELNPIEIDQLKEKLIPKKEAH